MAQQYANQQIKIRTSILVFIKGGAAPLVLYVDKPHELYEELQQLMRSGANIFVERDANGPLKKVAFMSGQIAGLALQDEQYV